jgi:signal peptidase I
MEFKNVKPTFEPGDYVLFIPYTDSGMVDGFAVVERCEDNRGDRILRWDDGTYCTPFYHNIYAPRHINIGPLTEKEWLVMRLKYGF